MENRGSIKDCSVRIIPSKRFLEFLQKIDMTNDVPNSIKQIVKKESVGDVPSIKLQNENGSANVQSNVYMGSKDFELLKSILKDKSLNDLSKDKMDQIEEKSVSSEKADPIEKKESSDINKCLYIKDLEWLAIYLDKMRNDSDCVYLHELLDGCEIVLPENEIIERNPELEARCVRLKKEQDNRQYRNMTKNVDNVRKKQPEDTLAYQMKAMNSHIIAIVQFLMSIAAGFLFGFLGVELLIGNLDFGFRLLLGVMCALVIALAEIYFLAKKLNEDMAIEETLQVGGPPVFPSDLNQKVHVD